jgi:hypothetical protein
MKCMLFFLLRKKCKMLKKENEKKVKSEKVHEKKKVL